MKEITAHSEVNVPVRGTFNQMLARLDWNISPSTKAFLRYNLQRETQPFAYGLWWRGGPRQVPYPTPVSGEVFLERARRCLCPVIANRCASSLTCWTRCSAGESAAR